MKYEMMVPPFEPKGFSSFTKKETEEYFQWYVEQVPYRINLLERFVQSEDPSVFFDWTPESLIGLWRWFETKIEFVEKSDQELKEELENYPEWMHSEISKEKFSFETLKYITDISSYFAEVVIRNSNGKIQWGYFTKSKKRMSVNEPVLLGFTADIDLNPRLIVYNCAGRSSKEKNANRLYEIYHVWQEDIL